MCFGTHVQLVRAGAHPVQPYRELLSPDWISQPNGLWPGLTGQKEQGHSPGFLFQEWVSTDVSGCKTQGGTQLRFIFNHASLLACFLRKMDQASFPFPLSLSKTSEGHTTSILALPLEEKQSSFSPTAVANPSQVHRSPSLCPSLAGTFPAGTAAVGQTPMPP